MKIFVTHKEYGSFESIEQPVNNLDLKRTRDWMATQLFKDTLSLQTGEGIVLIPVKILSESIVIVTGLEDPKGAP